MTSDGRESPSRAVVTVLLASAVAGAMLLGVATPVAATDVTKDEADDLSHLANFTVALPFQTDHYPGSENEANGSIQYWAAGDEAFAEMDAEDGVFFNYIEVGADWIDYTECETANTYAFGIDRGNDNTGVKYDDDLLDHQERSNFHDAGIDIWFFDWDDWYDPPYMAPEDAVVAEQGARSNAGACLTMTDETGWYQVQAFVNGTVADNGPDQQPSDSAESVGMNLNSNYIYVCECDSRAEAEEQLGPAPDDEGSSSSGDDPTPTPTPADDGDDPTPTPTDVPEDEPTPTPDSPDDGTSNDGSDDGTSDGDDGGGDGETADGGEDGDDGSAAGSGDDAGTTPTPGEGPGFGPVVAILALLGSALVVRRYTVES